MLWVLTGAFLGSFASVLLKAGAIRLERSWPSLLLNWRLAAGAATYFVSSLFYIRGISNGELSLLQPLIAVGYVWTMLWARLFFGEPLTKTKFAALFVILAGLAMIGGAAGTAR